ncbi:hypothetical protein F5X96DRAFT_618694 [Biscogniauxia mediterranea]|nr:hypothetical protein F5X96DRAFT_618694 [Biscogniauxia mediterranea]
MKSLSVLSILILCNRPTLPTLSPVWYLSRSASPIVYLGYTPGSLTCNINSNITHAATSAMYLHSPTSASVFPSFG